MNADPNIRDDNGYSPILLCILMRVLSPIPELTLCSNLTIKNNFGQNIVHLCLLVEDLTTLQELQNKKPNTIKQIFEYPDTIFGRTSLHYAVILKLDQFLSYLSMLDANLDIQDKYGDTR
jgi:ankyrin repeat protein